MAVVQASLIGQTFALLSGRAKHLAIVDAFHGTVISLARRCKVFQTQHIDQPDQRDLEHSWKCWVQTEERIRVAMGLRIHDAEIASLLHHETFLPSASRMSQVSNDVLFTAPSAQEWFALCMAQGHHSLSPVAQSPAFLLSPNNLSYRLSVVPDHAYFMIYSALEDICSEIIEARVNDTLTTSVVEHIHKCLTVFYGQHLRESQFEPLKNGCRILWHYLFILLHSEMDFLEHSVGKDGPNLHATDLSKVQTWANSSSAQRCVAHTIMIKRNLESFPLNSEPAIHIPKCVFSGLICLFCYMKYGDDETDLAGAFVEFRLFDINITTMLRELRGSVSSDIGMDTLYGLVDLLKRIGHWEISRTFASIIETLLHAEAL